MDESKILQVLDENKKVIVEFVQDFLPKGHEVPEIDLLYKMLADYPLRPGKGLRSMLLLLFCEAFNGDRRRALPTAVALELFHNWVLIHDDIEDGSEMRRGEPVLHRKYGIPLALNAGDALHGKMWELLVKNRAILGDGKALTVMEEFIKMVNQTTEGQHLELCWVRDGKWDLDESDYYLLCEKKTSWYTCITPARLGLLIADADSKLLDLMVPFGRSLGIAFQLQDDILNLIKGEDKYGKELAGDLWESKRTLILIRALSLCNSQERERALEILNKRREEKREGEVLEVLELIKRKGAIEYAAEKAWRFADEAKSILDKILEASHHQEAKNRLKEFIYFMVSRRW